jgi:hypothetical protein
MHNCVHVRPTTRPKKLLFHRCHAYQCHRSRPHIQSGCRLCYHNFVTFDVVEMALYVTEKSMICLVVAIPVQINWTHHDRCCTYQVVVVKYGDGNIDGTQIECAVYSYDTGVQNAKYQQKKPNLQTRNLQTTPTTYNIFCQFLVTILTCRKIYS